MALTCPKAQRDEWALVKKASRRKFRLQYGKRENSRRRLTRVTHQLELYIRNMKDHPKSSIVCLRMGVLNLASREIPRADLAGGSMKRLRQWLLLRFPLMARGSIRYCRVNRRGLVLRLFDGDMKDPIIGGKEVVDVANPPAYPALSYTWADERGDKSVPSERIFLGPDKTPFPITKNCHSALRRLREQHWGPKARNGWLLWVDAICINQSDTLKRTHQVALMRHIYLQASQTLVYFGEASQSSDLAIQKMDDVVRNVPLHSLSHESREVTVSLFRRPYFSRVWILQDIILPRSINIYYGASTLQSFTVSNLVISEAFPDDVQSLAGGVFNEVSQFGNSVGLDITAAVAASITAQKPSTADGGLPDGALDHLCGHGRL